MFTTAFRLSNWQTVPAPKLYAPHRGFGDLGSCAGGKIEIYMIDNAIISNSIIEMHLHKA